MKIYIAYKYSYIKDKNQLKKELLEVSKTLEKFGHETFILGRDVQNWDNTVHPIHSKLIKMSTQIKNSDAILAYITSQKMSFGLMFELHLAKLLGKEVIIVTKKGIKSPYYNLMSSKSAVFKKVDDLAKILK